MAFLCHEIRNPLHIIAANADFLMETRITEEQSEFIRSVSDSAQLMTSIVNDVLDLQRLQSGRMSFERIPVDLHDVCQSLLKNIQHQAVNKRVQLLFDWEQGTPRHVISDPTRIHQLLLNFASNAIKFTQEGSVTLRVSLLSAATQAKMFPVLTSSSRRLDEKDWEVQVEDADDDMQPTQSLLSLSSSSQSTAFVPSSSATTTANGSHATPPTTALLTLHQFSVRSISGQTIAMNFAASTQQTENERFIHDAEEEAYDQEAVDDEDNLLPLSPHSRPSISPQHATQCKRGRQTQYICFRVTDTGMGISPHALPQLFSPYTQAKLSVVREKGGTGLGLSICREIISNLHGQIQVHSELGKGSTFTFVLRMPLSSEKEWLKAQHDNYHVSVRQHDEENMSALQRRGSHTLGTSNLGEQFIMPTSQEPTTSMSTTSELTSSLMSPTSLSPPSSSAASDFSILPATLHVSRLRSLANKSSAFEATNTANIYKPNSYKSSSPNSLHLSKLTPCTPLIPSPSSSTSSGSPTPVARSVLVADDNDVNRKILSRILTSLGYRPVMANDGVQAVEAVKANLAAGGPPFLCVFMDISMPHLDGYEATRHIRALGYHVTIIALTANALSEERRKALEAGMNAFQTKPIRKAELQKLLHKIDAEYGVGSGTSSTVGSGSDSTMGSVPPTQRLSLVSEKRAERLLEPRHHHAIAIQK